MVQDLDNIRARRGRIGGKKAIEVHRSTSSSIEASTCSVRGPSQLGVDEPPLACQRRSVRITPSDWRRPRQTTSAESVGQYTGLTRCIGFMYRRLQSFEALSGHDVPRVSSIDTALPPQHNTPPKRTGREAMRKLPLHHDGLRTVPAAWECRCGAESFLRNNLCQEPSPFSF